MFPMFLRCALCVLLAASSTEAWRTIPAKDLKEANTTYGGFTVTTNQNLSYMVCDTTNTNSVGQCTPLGHERARCYPLKQLRLPAWDTVGVNLTTKSGVCHCDMVRRWGRPLVLLYLCAPVRWNGMRDPWRDPRRGRPRTTKKVAGLHSPLATNTTPPPPPLLLLLLLLLLVLLLLSSPPHPDPFHSSTVSHQIWTTCATAESTTSTATRWVP